MDVHKWGQLDVSIFIKSMVWMDFFFSVFACSLMNCTYLFIYSAIKWNQHHILVMIECSNRDGGGLALGHGQWNKRYSGMILKLCVLFFFSSSWSNAVRIQVLFLRFPWKCERLSWHWYEYQVEMLCERITQIIC